MDFEQIRLWETYKLWLPIWEKQKSNARMIEHGIDPYTPKFNGFNPLTAAPVCVVFDEPTPGRASILQWSPNMKSWTYSDDAGVRWQRVEFKDYVKKTDCLMSEPEYPKE